MKRMYLHFSKVKMVEPDENPDDIQEILKGANLFGKYCSPSESISTDKGNTKVTDWVKKLKTLKLDCGIKVHLDNSQGIMYNACWANSTLQAFWRLFDDKEWEILINRCVDLEDSKNHVNIEIAKLYEISNAEDDDNDPSLKDEIAMAAAINQMNLTQKTICRDAFVTHMDIVFRGSKGKEIMEHSSLFVVHVSTFPLSQKIMSLFPGIFSDGVSAYYDIAEFIPCYMEVLQKYDPNLFDFLFPEVGTVTTCLKCRKTHTTPLPRNDYFQIYFGNPEYTKKWTRRAKLPTFGLNKEPAFYYKWCNKFQTTYLTITVQELLDNSHPSFICGTHETIDPSNKFEASDNDADRVTKRNTASGLQCSKSKCANASYTIEPKVITINRVLAISMQECVESRELFDGQLDASGDVAVVTDEKNTMHPQIIMKYWLEDFNSIGRINVGDKEVKLRLTTVIFRTNNQNDKDGHFVTAVRLNNTGDKNVWNTYDDNDVDPGLPKGDEYYPIMFFFEKVIDNAERAVDGEESLKKKSKN